jgi:hypothetical protein
MKYALVSSTDYTCSSDKSHMLSGILLLISSVVWVELNDVEVLLTDQCSPL